LNRTHVTRLSVSAALVVVVALAGCDGSGGERREWAAADHHGEQRNRAQVAGTAEPTEDATLVEVTWRQNCAVCHGLGGKGDTQQGQMLRVPDLTRPELAQVNDELLVATIRRGRNKMPAFDKLPERVVVGLVRYLRSFAR